MYLLTFATLIIGIIGIYGQVIAVQTARMAASQSGFATAMAEWQAAAVVMGTSIYNTEPTVITGTGCSLTFGVPNTCPPPPGVSSGTLTTGTTILNQYYDAKAARVKCLPLLGSTNADGTCHLQYDAADYMFNSLLYNDGTLGGLGKNYVVTYVKPAVITQYNPAPGLLTLAGGNQVGFTMGDLAQQLNQAHIPGYSYGTVRSSKLTPNVKLVVSPGGGYYNVPVSIPDGSLAMIASPDGF